MEKKFTSTKRSEREKARLLGLTLGGIPSGRKNKKEIIQAVPTS